MRFIIFALSAFAALPLAAAIDGLAARKFVVKVAYTVRAYDAGRPVDENVGATILVWTTGAVDAARAVRPFRLTTGEAGVDALLEPALAKVTGFPLKTSLSATRMFKGAPPETLLITSTVSNIRTVDAPPHAFDRPRLEQAAEVRTPPQ